MKMTSELVTLAEAEEDLDEDSDEDDDDEEEDSSHDDDGSKSEMFAFNVPHFRYIDDDDAEENMDEGRVAGWRNTSGTWSSCYSEEDYCNSSSYRYVVVSGTPLKILEHLLSDLRLDDQRGAPENKESGEFGHM